MKKKNHWWVGKEDVLIKKYAPWRALDFSSVSEINDNLDDISQARTSAQVGDALAKFCNKYGIHRSGYLCVKKESAGFSGGSQISYNNESYRDAYFSENIIDIDAYRFLTSDCVHPVPIGLPHHRKFDSKEERKYMAIRDEFKVGRGVQITYNTPHWNCAFGLVVEDSERDFVLRLPVIAAQAQIFGIALHDAIKRVSSLFKSPSSIDAANYRLTRRELECLHWAAAGKTAWETSCILSIAERTVFVHMDNAKKKLEAKTLPQAVGRAIMLGLISL